MKILRMPRLSDIKLLATPTKDLDKRAKLQLIRERNQFTPDIPTLDQNVAHCLFVVGNEQLGHFNQAFLQNPLDFRVGPAVTHEKLLFPKFILGEKSYPIPIRTSIPDKDDWFTSPKDHVRGDLYRVPLSTIIKLDTLYKNGRGMWYRTKVQVKIPYEKWAYFEEPFCSPERIVSSNKPDLAWMYMGVGTHWIPILDCGYNFETITRYPCHPKNPNIKSYYWFTTEECKHY